MKKRLASLLLALAALTACATAPEQPSQPAPAPPAQQDQQSTAYTFTDALGNTVTVDRPQRVVSFYGSFAEMWVLAGGTLVGTTDDAITQRELPLGDNVTVIGGTKTPNLELALGLEPDFALLSADTSDHVQAAETLRAAGVPCAFFRVDYLEDYLAAMEICTAITGRSDLYEQNAQRVEQQAQAVIQRVRPRLAQNPPTALLIRAYSTGAKAKGMDNLAGVILHELGVKNLVEDHPSLLEELSMEEIIAADPDYIFVTTMGSSQKALDALRDGIQSNPAWASLSAVQNDRYILLPEDLFHYKPNDRWGESYAYLANILCPEG
ncbi:MAG: ABC transporter substrate-binding protein [Angelakisella sp.]|jgi:iron complex transport system substrate-binding protein|nr:ABC transporter substrate-binding protein [Angelakisella sp.]